MKRIRKQIAVVLSLCLLVCACTACGPAKEQVFTRDNFSITLTDKFVEFTDPRGFGYSDKTAVIVVVNQSKEEIKEAGLNITSLNRFAILSLKSYDGADNAFVRDGLNHSYCEFESVSNGRDTSFYAAFYETDTHYWLVLCGCDKGDYADYQANFANWASTVTVQ